MKQLKRRVVSFIAPVAVAVGLSALLLGIYGACEYNRLSNEASEQEIEEVVETPER